MIGKIRVQVPCLFRRYWMAFDDSTMFYRLSGPKGSCAPALIPQERLLAARRLKLEVPRKHMSIDLRDATVS